MINKIRDNVKKNLGKEVSIIHNGSRNKKEEYIGVISEVYNNIFILKLNNNEIRSFSYFDVLTNNVQIFFDKI